MEISWKRWGRGEGEVKEEVGIISRLIINIVIYTDIQIVLLLRLLLIGLVLVILADHRWIHSDRWCTNTRSVSFAHDKTDWKTIGWWLWRLLIRLQRRQKPATNTKSDNRPIKKNETEKTVHFRWAIRSDKRLVKYDGVILNKSLGKQKNSNNNIKYTKCLVGTSEKKREGQDWLRWNLWTNTCSPPTDTNTRSLRVDSLEFAFNRVYKWENFVYVKNDLPTRQVSYSRHAKHSFPNKKKEKEKFSFLMTKKKLIENTKYLTVQSSYTAYSKYED